MGKPAVPQKPPSIVSNIIAMAIGMTMLIGFSMAVLTDPPQKPQPAPIVIDTSASPSPDALRTGIQPTPEVSR